MAWDDQRFERRIGLGTPIVYFQLSKMDSDINIREAIALQSPSGNLASTAENVVIRFLEKNVNKWIILHDTITFGYTDEEFYQNGKISENISSIKKEKTGLKPAIEDFLKNNACWTVEKEYTNNNGLTILKRVC